MHDLEIMGLVAAAVGGFGVIITVMALRQFIARHGLATIIVRHFAGLPHNGLVHTDAGVFTWGSKITSNRGSVSRWHHRPIAHRAGIRWAYTLGIAATVYGAIMNMQATEYGLIAAAGAGLVGAAAGSVVKIRRHQHDAHVVSPMAEALALLLGMSPAAARDSISLDPGFRTVKPGEKVGTIVLPDDYKASPDQRASAEHLITQRLGIDASYTWATSSHPYTLKIGKARELPKMVWFADYLQEIRALKPGQFIAGVTHTGLYVSEFSGENPMKAMVWNTGRGKSTQLKSMIVQLALNEPDARFLVADPKDVSLLALAGIPGLKIEFFGGSDDVPGMWNCFRTAHREMIRRYDILKTDPSAEFPALYVIAEELNSLAQMSKPVWQKMRLEDPDLKKVTGATPAFWGDYIAPLLWRGRQSRVFTVCSAQSFYDKDTGGLGLRGSFAEKSLSGFTPKMWDSAVQTTPVPKSQPGIGRALYTTGEDRTWVQALFIKDEEIAGLFRGNVQDTAPAGEPITIKGEVIA